MENSNTSWMLGLNFKCKNWLTLSRVWTRIRLSRSLLKFQKMRLSTSPNQFPSQAKFSSNTKRKRALTYCLKIASASEQIFLNSCLNELKSTCIAQSDRRVTLSLLAFQKLKLGMVKSCLTRTLLLLLKAKHQV